MINSQNTICLAVELKFINASDGDITLSSRYLSLVSTPRGSETPILQVSLMHVSHYGSPSVMD
jgi:hypothetical protein